MLEFKVIINSYIKYEFKFSLDILEEISENWRGRRALSIFTIDSIYIGEDYTKVINEYKSNRVIKDFEYSRFDYGINYCHR
ncbi:hypothetical protein RhiirA5_431975 [Rhizophagus irregularis]|uniref:Uncharacterized protein n=1 Tax=Rhizophagus irregularis TaxID=588596 RepID=A0A2N0NU24_9GLOM|nr:hypothetical protein RhiirA5_431975 [Rhizophagus irregularis]